MRINIVTSGRFHVLDLARELAALGHEVRFHSYVPLRRARKFGLPQCSHRGLLGLVFPLVGLARLVPRRWRRVVDEWLQLAVDHLVAWRMEPCDVFIGMSGLCVVSAETSRRKFGATVFLERGSRHVESQKEILQGIPDMPMPPVTDFDVRRELEGYELADVISVPSRHVESSFLERGTPQVKLFRNPYGVDLSMFPPTAKPSNAIPVVLMAGTWSLRKGCHLLWQACEQARSWRLLHVGPVGDAPVPRSPWFEHHASVPQWQLVEHFKRADVFALASFEEGLSLVQAQALACGLPVVCTDRTGGEDLRDVLATPNWITMVPSGDCTALRHGIERALAIAATQTGIRDILGRARDELSWKAYGVRYHDRLMLARPEFRQGQQH